MKAYRTILLTLLLLFFFPAFGREFEGERTVINFDVEREAYSDEKPAYRFSFINDGFYAYVMEFKIMDANGTFVWSPWIGDYRNASVSPGSAAWINRKEGTEHWIRFKTEELKSFPDSFVRIVGMNQENLRHYIVWSRALLDSFD